MHSKHSKKIAARKARPQKAKKTKRISVEQFLKHPSKRRNLLVGILVLLIGITFWRYLIFEYLYLFKDIGTDTITIFYPNLLHASQYLRTEGFTFWSFCAGLGQGSSGVNILDNPFNWVLYVLGVDKLAYGIAYMEALKILSIGIFFFLYAQTVGFSRFTCLIGSILMAFSGYAILGSTWYGHSKFVLDGVLILLAFELLFKKNKWWLFPLTIISIIGTKLYFMGVFLLIYSLFRFIDTKGWKPKKLIELYAQMAFLGILGVLFVAPFLGSTVYKLLYSPRVAGGVSYVDQLSDTGIFSLEEPIHYITVITRFFSNDLLGGGINYSGWKNYLEAPEFYCGLLTLLLIPQLFTLLNKRRKIIYACLLGVWLWIIVFPYFRYAFYLFVGDYYKNALSLFVTVSCLFTGMMGLNLIHRGGRVHVKVLLASLAVLLLLLNFPYETTKGIVNTNLQKIISFLLIVHAVLLFLWQYRKTYRYRLQWLLLLTVCFEVVYLSNYTINDRDAIEVKDFQKRTGYNDYTKDAIAHLKSIDKGFYRVDKTYSCFSENETKENTITIGSPNDAKALYYYSTPSYDSHNHRYYVRFLQETGLIKKGDEIASRWVVGLVTHPILESLVSVKYLLTTPQSDNFADPLVFKQIHQIENIQIYQNRYSLPMGVTYDHFVPLSDFRQLKNSMQKAMTMMQAVVIEDEDLSKYKMLKRKSLQDINQTYVLQDLTNKLISNSLQISHHSQNRIEGTISLSQPKMMFLSIPYDAGWSAKVNGQDKEFELVNTGFLGLMLPAGNHTVELSYSSPYFYQGWLVSLVALSLYLFLLWKFYWKRD